MSTSTAPPLRVDVTFERICFPLVVEDFAALELSLQVYGCREPLVVWDETGILLDGHHRKRVCELHEIPFEVVRYSFPDRRAAHDWVIHNQLGRRNLTQQQASYLRGKLYNVEKRDPVETLKQGDEPAKSSGQNGRTGLTDERLARQTGVSARTVRRDGRRAAAIDAIAESAGDDARDEILAGNVRLSADDLDALAAAAPKSAEDVREFSEEQRAKRLRARRPPRADAAWGQFEVVGVEVASDDDGRYVAARKLSCGHTVRAARRVAYRGPGTGTKSANCPTCRPGTRTPHEKRRLERTVERALVDAMTDDDTRALVVEFVSSVVRALSFSHHPDARAHALLQRCAEIKHELRLTESE